MDAEQIQKVQKVCFEIKNRDDTEKLLRSKLGGDVETAKNLTTIEQKPNTTTAKSDLMCKP